MNTSLRTIVLYAFIASISACQKSTPGSTHALSSTAILPSAPPPDAVVGKVAGKEITQKMLVTGIENTIYEAEKKIYDLKVINLRNIMLDTVLVLDPNSQAMKREAYITKYITNDISVDDQDLANFIAEKKIPEFKLDENLKHEITQYLRYKKEDAAIDAYIRAKSGKDPVEIFLVEPKEPVFEQDISIAPSMGSITAPVTIIEYSDFQCPFCKKGAEVMDQIREKYGDKVRVVFKNFPLPMHPDSRIAAEAGMCAYFQGNVAFWKMHDQMFSSQNQLTKPDLINSAAIIGLDKAAFIQCLDGGKTSARVDADLRDGANAKLRSTPTYYINDKQIDGLKQLDEFSKLIEEALNDAQANSTKK